jgi:hypothetical protein
MQRRRIEHMAPFAQCLSWQRPQFCFASACPAFDGIDFAARLNRLRHRWKTCAVASRAPMLTDLWGHVFHVLLSGRLGSRWPGSYPDSARRRHS